MSVTGIAEVQEGLRKLAEISKEATAKALAEEALKIEAASADLVPVDTGALRGSHVVDISDGGLTAKVGYGKDYALAVHEILDSHHPVGEAKYLEKPFRAALPGLVDRVAAKVERAL